MGLSHISFACSVEHDSDADSSIAKDEGDEYSFFRK